LTPTAIVVGGILLWLLKQVLGPLIGQQAKGSIPDYTADKARKAARLLPPDLAEEYEQAWVAELKGPGLKDRPLSALKFALGLRHAARGIRVKAGLSRFRLVEVARLKTAGRVLRFFSGPEGWVRLVIGWFVLSSLLGAIASAAIVLAAFFNFRVFSTLWIVAVTLVALAVIFLLGRSTLLKGIAYRSGRSPKA
jgi:hypothetical protein